MTVSPLSLLTALGYFYCVERNRGEIPTEYEVAEVDQEEVVTQGLYYNTKLT
jgi:hypothetical protein